MPMYRSSYFASLGCLLFLIPVTRAQVPCCPQFPPPILPQSEIYKADWYSRHLEALGETSIFPVPSNRVRQSYIFTRLQTSHRSIFVRIDVGPDGSSTLTKKVGGLKAKGSTNRIQLTTLELAKEQTLTFLTDLEQTHRWLLAIPEPIKGEQDHRAEWSVEWRRDGEYGGMTSWDTKNGYMQELSLNLALKIVLMKYRGESVIR
jgi:hypothetical protein